MGKSRKWAMTALWAVLVAAMVAFIATWASVRLYDRGSASSTAAPAAANPIGSAAKGTLPVLYDAPTFTLVDQDDKAFGTENLRGRPWIADFIFTRCTGPCPRMTAAMRQLQKDLADPRITLVSLSVDPAFDQPPVLREYAKKFGADEASWRFLTGGKTLIYQIARGLKVTAVEATEDAPIIHSARFILIDGDGQVRGYYVASEADAMERLIADAKALAGAPVDAGKRP